MEANNWIKPSNIKIRLMNFSETTKKIHWATSTTPVGYAQAVEFMETRVSQIQAGEASELIWLLEHPPLITAGTSAQKNDLLQPERFEVFQSGRGGQYTYHGPGQRVVYVMLDLRKNGRDVRGFVRKLEQWLIAVLADYGLAARRYDDRVGVWVDRKPDSEAKIAAIGIRICRWISFHGISLNVDPDLSHFEAIIPCGISHLGVTSFKDLKIPTTMIDVDTVLKDRFIEKFGEVETCEPPQI